MSVPALAQGDTVVKQSAAHAIGASMDAVRTWSDVSTLTCLIQTTSGSESSRYNARGSHFSHWAFFASDPSLTVNNRLKWTVEANQTLATAKYLRVLACYPEGRPGGNFLWVCECELETTRSEA
jgi:hypothetical protein